jgi:hypothetical protein
MSAIQRHAVSRRKNDVACIFFFLLCLIQLYYVCYLQLAMKPAHSVPATKTIPTFASSSTASPTPSPAVAARYVTAVRGQGWNATAARPEASMPRRFHRPCPTPWTGPCCLASSWQHTAGKHCGIRAHPRKLHFNLSQT